MRSRLASVLAEIDVIVAALLLLGGIAFAVFLGIEGATVIEVGLVLVLTVVLTAYWATKSSALEWLRDRR